MVSATGTPFASWVERNGTKVGVEYLGSSSYGSIATSSGNNSEYSPGDSPDTISGHCFDAPASTSALTYAVWVGMRTDDTRSFRLNYSQNYSISGVAQGWQLPGTCKITLMEIAG